ncbi:MAG TPA: DUF2911 domain-containing protein [Terriglobia bacterium]|nr:DUF2911 domain-containing protein [Terriglobia bacterium]
MRRYSITMLTVVLSIAFAGAAMAQHNARGMTKIEANSQTVSIDYGRPSLHGRNINDMLGKLPAGGFWRLGADSSTTFKTGTDLKFGDVTVPKGTYSLWAQKESDNSWKLVFNTQHGQWGTQHDPSKDAYFVPLTEAKAGSPQNLVTITLTKEGDNGGMFDVVWGDLELTAHFTAQ